MTPRVTRWVLASFSTVLYLLVILSTCLAGSPADRNHSLTFPDLGAESFRTDLFGWLINGYKSQAMHIHYSAELDRGAMYFTDTTNSYFFLWDKDGVKVQGDKYRCLNTTTPSLMAETVRVSKYALDPENMTFVEATSLAGIPVNHWQTNYPFKLGIISLKATVSVYLAREDAQWEMYSASRDPKLLRLWLRIFQDGYTVEDVVFDVLNFHRLSNDVNKYQSDLEPPVGLLCGRGLEDPEDLVVPDIPSSVKYGQETVNRMLSLLEMHNDDTVVLDKDKQIMQIDGSKGGFLRDVYGGATYTTFISSKHAWTCFVGKVNTVHFSRHDGNEGFKVVENDVKLDSAEELLYMSGDFVFIGEDEVRGIPCYAFSRVVDDYNDMRMKATILLYFSKPGVMVYSDKGPTENVVVKIEVLMEHFGKLVFNVYGLSSFSMDKSREEMFDISHCFRSDQQVEVSILFDIQGESSALTALERRALEHGSRELIADVCDLDIVRVSVGKAVQSSDMVGLTAKIFARPNSGTHFEPHFGKSFGSGSEAIARIRSTHRVVDSEKCINLADKDPEVTDIDFCSGSKTCTLYGPPSVPQQDITPEAEAACVHLTKISSYHSRTTMQQAWETLRKTVRNNNFTIKVGDTVFSAFTVKQTNDLSAARHANSSLSQFKKLWGVEMITRKGGLIRQRLDLSECANQCLNNLAFTCQAFSHCVETSACELHGTYPTAAITSYQKHHVVEVRVGCDTYARSYLHNFEQLPGLAPEVTVGDRADGYIDVPDPEKCAQLCMENNGTQCESFDYCTGDRGCVLRRYHARDYSQRPEEGKSNREETNCTHYSRSYLWDYARMEGVTSLPANRYPLSVSTTEGCAYECSASPSCDTFQFCDGPEGGCNLLDTSDRRLGPWVMTPRYQCYTYAEKDDADILRRALRLHKRLGVLPASGRNGYSGGAMAGLAVGMLAVGVALSFLGLLVWSMIDRRRRGQPNDNMEDAFDMPEATADDENL